MYNARVQRRQSRKRSCRRNRIIYGGGAGQSYSFGASVDPNNPGLGSASVIPSGGMHCGNAVSGGHIQDRGTTGGVPGFGGKMYGGRRSSSSDPIDTLMKMVGQTGGGYTMNPLMGSNPFMDRQYSGCGEGAFATRNPLNELAPSTITAPPALKGGRRCWSRRNRRMNGGAAVDGMVYEAPRAGYTFAPSSSGGGNAGTLADGKAPFAVHVPYTAQPTASPACLKTGGSRRRNRKASRKSRKASRRN